MRVWRSLLVVLVLLACCALLVSSFEVAKKKTDKPKKEAAAATGTAAPHTATIAPDGAVTVDDPAAPASSAAATTTTTATATATAPAAGAATPAVRTKPSKPAVASASSASSAESTSEAAPVLSGPLVLPLEHDLVGDGSWTGRGTVEVTFGSSGSSQRAAVKLSELTLSDAEQQQLLKLAASNGYYRVRVPTSPTQAPAGKVAAATPVLASSRACAVVASALHETFTLHFDIHATLLALTYTTPITACPAVPANPASPAGLALPAAAGFTSRGRLSFGRTAERPLNVRVRQQPGEVGGVAAEGGGAAGGEAKGEEQSFFMKYWMYIVPFGLFMVVQAFMSGPDKGPGGEGGGQQAAAR